MRATPYERWVREAWPQADGLLANGRIRQWAKLVRLNWDKTLEPLKEVYVSGLIFCLVVRLVSVCEPGQPSSKMTVSGSIPEGGTATSLRYESVKSESSTSKEALFEWFFPAMLLNNSPATAWQWLYSVCYFFFFIFLLFFLFFPPFFSFLLPPLFFYGIWFLLFSSWKLHS